ncbi:MAG TPA: hypothetical protein GX497_01605 [Bacillus bacterium]|nr:hypothetical protein [Bacillus sp. (in: firmicutes)]
MNVIKNIFVQFNLSYLIKSYIISIAMTYITWGYIFVGDPSIPKIFFIANLILFPFATIIYDTVIDMLFGGNVILLPAPVLIIYKIIKIYFLYMLAILLAPIGIIFLYIRSRII